MSFHRCVTACFFFASLLSTAHAQFLYKKEWKEVYNAREARLTKAYDQGIAVLTGLNEDTLSFRLQYYDSCGVLQWQYLYRDTQYVGLYDFYTFTLPIDQSIWVVAIGLNLDSTERRLVLYRYHIATAEIDAFEEKLFEDTARHTIEDVLVTTDNRIYALIRHRDSMHHLLVRYDAGALPNVLQYRRYLIEGYKTLRLDEVETDRVVLYGFKGGYDTLAFMKLDQGDMVDWAKVYVDTTLPDSVVLGQWTNLTLGFDQLYYVGVGWGAYWDSATYQQRGHVLVLNPSGDLLYSGQWWDWIGPKMGVLIGAVGIGVSYMGYTQLPNDTQILMTGTHMTRDGRIAKKYVWDDLADSLLLATHLPQVDAYTPGLGTSSAQNFILYTQLYYDTAYKTYYQYLVKAEGAEFFAGQPCEASEYFGSYENSALPIAVDTSLTLPDALGGTLQASQRINPIDGENISSQNVCLYYPEDQENQNITCQGDTLIVQDPNNPRRALTIYRDTIIELNFMWCQQPVQYKWIYTFVPDVQLNVFVPKAFTPNGDGLNDYFGLTLVDTLNTFIEEYHLVIFNRWGEKVFETADLNRKWDGTFRGKPAPAGVYVYAIRARGRNDRRCIVRFTRQGDVTLVR